MTRLVRGLGFWGASSLVVGTIIGTGVFLKTAVMAQLGGSPAWVLAAWAVAGILSFAGAMTYAELGGMFPAAGGEYVYLRRGYGPFMAYLYAWNRFWIATPGSIAAYAVGSATFIGVLVPVTSYVVATPLGDLEALKVVALGFIAVFTAINCMNVRTGGHVQTAMTVLKVVMIGGLAIGALVAPRGSWSHVATAGGFPGWPAFGAMVLAALWAYDGWNNLPMAAGEVRDPQRNVPRAILGGAVVVFAIYAVVNLGYFHALPFAEVATSSSTKYPDAPAVAARVAEQFLGDTTQALLAAAMALSALSAMNGSMLTGARVPYAVARDRLAPQRLANLSGGARVPTTSVLVQGVLACAFAFSGRFDQLTDAVVFASWLFYGLNAGSVLVLRLREPDRVRPFRVPGYPVVPIVFVLVTVLLLVNTVYTTFWPSVLGLAMTALGALVYVAFLRGRARPLVDEDESAAAE
ncbi:MAG TPA: amino acid permease [Kofleriaceae bacterium]|nr:amino acid permease [Kofleriaceae bacterium]